MKVCHGSHGETAGKNKYRKETGCLSGCFSVYSVADF